MQRNFNSRKIGRSRKLTPAVIAKLPVNDVRIGEYVPQEAKARDDHGVAKVIRARDGVENCHRQYIPGSGGLHEEWPCQRMNKVQVGGSNIGGPRAPVEGVVEGVSGFEDHRVARVSECGGRDRRVPSIVASPKPLFRARNWDVSDAGDWNRDSACKRRSGGRQDNHGGSGGEQDPFHALPPFSTDQTESLIYRAAQFGILARTAIPRRREIKNAGTRMQIFWVDGRSGFVAWRTVPALATHEARRDQPLPTM